MKENKNLICVPFAYDYKAESGVNLTSNKIKRLEYYFKNLCVSLVSAKKHNQEDDVALITNLNEDIIEKEYIKILNKNNIKIIYCSFDEFVFQKDYLWNLAFYKLNILSYLEKNTDYKNICYMDADVYVQDNFQDIWKECEENIMLYDINHGLGTKDYEIICDEFEKFLDKKIYITHFGGEFLAINRKNIGKFIKSLKDVYNKMLQDNFKTTKGDEFILSIAANENKNIVKNAGAYIYRFWTSLEFRLVSTNYKYNRIVILHVPSEKQSGMIKIYDKYIKKNKLPKEEKVWRILHLMRPSLANRIKYELKKIIRKF